MAAALAHRTGGKLQQYVYSHPPRCFSINLKDKTLVFLFITLTRGEGIAFGSVCLSVCLSTQNFSTVFLCNRLSDWHRIFTIRATTHRECFNYNSDIIGHVVWQPCWKNGKHLDWCISETETWKKNETWHIASAPDWKEVWFLYDVIGAFMITS